MLYYLFEFIEKQFQFPGASLFQFLSFRASVAILLSLIFTLIYGKKIINYLRRKQIGETIRDLGLEGQAEKSGTPTMGGIIIILGTLIPVLLLTRLDNIYIQLLIVTTITMGSIGLIDDYIKIFKKDKEGLKGKFKVIGQLMLGVFVGSVLYFHPAVTVKQEIVGFEITATTAIQEVFSAEKKSTLTTIPMLKGNEFDYADLLTWISPKLSTYAWIIFIPIVVFIVIAVSNGANLTDGIDGLAAGSSAIMVIALGVFAWVSGNLIFSKYLNIMYIPNVGEVVVFIAALMGSLIGFLWYNTYPASVFMGDTGSLTIGAIIAVIAIIVRKELLIPLLCGIFLIENVSVIMQVGYFKYTKKKTGIGRRIFKMSPLHHHYQKLGYHESKIVARFWIIGILLAVLSIVTLKIR
ncbi:phospho-N-acetylmuramoyl-pentapeptide-transferase [Flavobacteriaceae bacterium]|jgi:phospho-N-acetylmuramoyl-pentapeptide-transferase|nr:phospho-N-acetylmuramoyl-pentapeptide-transferase [Flavobacteriaceae bacterium]MDA9250385.1 phospho-N-acetylmuramoyl-pentapeptide-transferase [Flavobacteriaceae bacterium]